MQGLAILLSTERCATNSPLGNLATGSVELYVNDVLYNNRLQCRWSNILSFCKSFQGLLVTSFGILLD